MPSTADPAWWKSKRQAFKPPTLHPELWMYIFRIATRVPWALETETLDHFLESAPLSRREESFALKASFRTKQSLVLVCKQWRDIAFPVMYSIVTSNCSKGLMRLRRTLLDSGETAQLLRGSVRRLHCTLDPTEEPTYEWDHLAELIEVLPNLAIFNMHSATGLCVGPEDTHWAMPTSMMVAFEHRGASVRVLDWQVNNILPIDPRHWRDLLSRLPNLRILRHDGDDSWSETPRPLITSFTPLKLPHLTSTSWDIPESCYRLVPEDNLPSLRTLDIMMETSPPLPPPNIANRITALTLHHTSSDGIDSGTWYVICKAMPNLVQLVLWVGIWQRLSLFDELPANLERLGLGRRIATQSSNKELKTLLENLYAYDAPKLKVVRFVGGDDWTLLPKRSPKVLKRLRDLTPTRAFTIECPDGSALLDLH